MTIQSILVFGATGTQGHPVVDAALRAGLSVRVASRDTEEAEEKLPGRVEVVEGDLTRAEEVAGAMTGMHAVFFHLPVMPDDPQAAAIVENVTRSAAEQGLKRIIFTTGGYCAEEMPSGIFVTGMQSVARSILDGQVPAVVLRPTFYLANLVWPHIIREIREYGRLTYPPLDERRRLSWTSTEDQGRIAVACLEADVAGEIIDVASPKPVTGPELCRMLADVFGREVHYAPQSNDEFAETMSHLSGSAHVGRVVAELYAGIETLADGPVIDTDALEHRLGVELMPVRDWMEQRLGRLLEMYG